MPGVTAPDMPTAPAEPDWLAAERVVVAPDPEPAPPIEALANAREAQPAALPEPGPAEDAPDVQPSPPQTGLVLDVRGLNRDETGKFTLI